MRLIKDIKSRLFLFFGMISPLILGMTVLVVSYITPGYDPISDSVSLMGTQEQPYAWLLNSGYWIYGVLMCFAAYGLNRIFVQIPQIKPLSILLFIHALGTILLAVFPDSTTSFYQEMLHNFMSGVAYVPLLAMIYVFRNLTRDSSSFSRLRTFGMLVLIINLPLPFVHMFEPLSSIGGLLQRVMCTCSFVWLRFAFFVLYKNRFSLIGATGRRSQLSSSDVRNSVTNGLPGIEVGHILQKDRRF